MRPASADPSLTARATWLVAAKTLAFACTIAIPLLLVRRMPQHEFGLYKQIFLIVSSAVGVLPLGFGLTAFYFLPREEEHRNATVFNVVLFTGAVATLFATVLSMFPSLLVLLFNEPEAIRFAPAIGAIIVLWVVGAFLEIVTVANHDIKIATTAIIAIQMTRAICFLTAAIVSGTVHALIIAAVLQGVVQVAGLLVYLRSRFPEFWRTLDLAFFWRQLAYALPFGVAGTLWTLEADLHNYFVSHHFGATMYAVYAIGCVQVPLFGILAESVGSVMIPRVSQLQHEQRTREIVLLMARVMRKLSAVYFPTYAFLMVMRREFIVGLFTDRYLASVPIFAINLTLIPLGMLMVDPIMRAYAEHRLFLVKLHGVLLVLLTAALALTIGRFGLIGAITLMVTFTYIGRFATAVKVIRILRVTARDAVLLVDVAKIAGATVAAAAMAAFTRTLTPHVPPLAALAICGVAFASAYAAAIVGFGIATPEERAIVVNRIFGALRSPRPLAQAATFARE